ncbi:hypothetical protein [Pelagibius sp. 7325]|uniref:hypothetical protein n=1 Tax=Pelagibius sp. 7325 TaxID=3131994 RepID=UPI0030ED5EDD
MIDQLDEIWWEDSWLLGWEKTDDLLVLYVDVHLRRDHPLFEPFDEKKHVGCYKTARLSVSGPQQVSGLPSARHDPQWNPAMDEYKDVGDIDVMNLGGDGRGFVMEVGAAKVADSFRLEVKGRSVDLIVEAF